MRYKTALFRGLIAPASLKQYYFAEFTSLKISDVTIRKFELKKTYFRESTAQPFRLVFETNSVIIIDVNGGGGGRFEKPPQGKHGATLSISG